VATMADHRMLRMKPTLVVTSAYAGTTDDNRVRLPRVQYVSSGSVR